MSYSEEWVVAVKDTRSILIYKYSMWFIVGSVHLSVVKSRDLNYQRAFGEHLKKLREEKEWSQDQLASVSNIDGNQISRIENGVHAPNLHTIRAIAAALGMQPYELLKFDFLIELNSDFSSQHTKKYKSGTSSVVSRIAQTEFLDTPRSVADIVEESEKVYQVSLKSAATSGALTRLTEEGLLTRIPAPKKGQYLYRKGAKS